MPATSRVSADSADIAEEMAPQPARLIAGRASVQPALWRDALRAALMAALRPAMIRYRQGWLYRQSFRGPVPDRILFHPSDLRVRRLDDADAFMRGRFRFGGEKVEVKQGSIFDAALPSERFAVALHGFDWLRHLELAGGDLARIFAFRLTQQWLKRHGRFTPFAWRPEIIAERLLNLFAHGRFFLINSDLVWRSRLFVSLRNQIQVLARTIAETPDGLDRLKASAALALAGLCLGDSRIAAAGLKRLSLEIDRQILPDGGHASRSPVQLLEAFRVLAMVQEALDHDNREVQPALRGGLDRMAPMLRFFCMGDGALTVFHGGNEDDSRTIEAVLDSDDAGGKPLGYAPHSGFQRLAAGRTLVLFDAGTAPPPAFSARAHAGCLAFEMSSGTQRVVVNCGTADRAAGELAQALRSTAAHSTCTLDDTPSAVVLNGGILARLLGPLLVDGPSVVETRRGESPQGLTAEASHDGYIAPFGIIHQRRMTLSPRGLMLTGADRLIPDTTRRAAAMVRGKRRVPFAIRFHIHPDVRLSLAQGGSSVLLKLPNGEGWRFRCGAALSIEESIYFGGGQARRAEQLVMSGDVADETIECVWLFEQVGPS